MASNMDRDRLQMPQEKRNKVCGKTVNLWNGYKFWIKIDFLQFNDIHFLVCRGKLEVMAGILKKLLINIKNI